MTREEFERVFDKYYSTAIINNISIYYDEYTIEFEDGEEIVNFFNEGGCSLICSIPLKDAGLVIRQQAEIKEWKRVVETWQELHEKDKAEIEMLKAGVNVELENYASEYDSKIKAEAIKEFAERLKDTRIKVLDEYMLYAQNVDVLVKEMVGEDK